MAILSSVPPPVHDPIATRRRDGYKSGQDPFEGLLTKPWIEYFAQLQMTVDESPVRMTSLGLTAQGASITASDMSNGALSAGLYRVSWYARITTPASTSSSLTVQIDWTDGGLTPSYSGAAITGNSTTSTQSESIVIRIDRNSPIRYATTYASVGAVSMVYALYLILEQLPA